MPDIDYRRLRQQITLAQVLDLVGFEARGRAGPQQRGRCPIPGCRSAAARSFSVHLGRQVYRCFACGSQGNALDLWAAVCGLPLHPAALTLCHLAHLEPPWLAAPAIRNKVPAPANSVANIDPSRNP